MAEVKSHVSIKIHKKNPPEFRHLPRDRARKLKQEWVKSKKIKAQWRHEKRREKMEKRSPEVTVPEEHEEPEASTSQVKSRVNTVSDNRDYDRRSPAFADNTTPLRARRGINNSSSEHNLREAVTTTQIPSHFTKPSHDGDTDRKRKAVDKSKKEVWTGKRPRPITMREKMSSLLDKIQKNLES